jgi:hypothetical protein
MNEAKMKQGETACKNARIQEYKHERIKEEKNEEIKE